MKKLGAMIGGLTVLLGVGVFAMERVTAETEYAEDTITLETANRMIEAAIEKSQELDLSMNIAILDSGGHLKAFARMDGALLGSIDIAQRKAKTSVLFRAPSGVIGSMSQPGGDLYGIERSNDGLITFGGGYPLFNADGEIIGAIGVSGSSVANDEAVAQAGAAAL